MASANKIEISSVMAMAFKCFTTCYHMLTIKLQTKALLMCIASPKLLNP